MPGPCGDRLTAARSAPMGRCLSGARAAAAGSGPGGRRGTIWHAPTCRPAGARATTSASGSVQSASTRTQAAGARLSATSHSERSMMPLPMQRPLPDHLAVVAAQDRPARAPRPRCASCGSATASRPPGSRSARCSRAAPAPRACAAPAAAPGTRATRRGSARWARSGRPPCWNRAGCRCARSGRTAAHRRPSTTSAERQRHLQPRMQA